MILGLIGDPDHTVSKPRASGDDPLSHLHGFYRWA